MDAMMAMLHSLNSLGRETLRIVSGFGEFGIFAGRTFHAVSKTRRLGHLIARSIFEQGIRCLPVIIVIGAFTGLVLGLQGYYVLTRFGSTAMLGTLVSLSLVREMAPVLAGLMLVGQAGSALAAELGIQRNSEQIIALETMGINSHGYLVTPRVIAALIVFPMQTALFVIIGLWGGCLSGSVLLGVESGVYWSAVERAIGRDDVVECFLKAMIFGGLTITLCAFHGFNAHRQRGTTGARAVSASTTQAVVQSSILILAADYAIASFFVR